MCARVQQARDDVRPQRFFLQRVLKCGGPSVIHRRHRRATPEQRIHHHQRTGPHCVHQRRDAPRARPLHIRAGLQQRHHHIL